MNEEAAALLVWEDSGEYAGPGSKSCARQTVLLPWPAHTCTCTPVSVHEGHSRAAVISATPASRGRPSNALHMVNDLARTKVRQQAMWALHAGVSGRGHIG